MTSQSPCGQPLLFDAVDYGFTNIVNFLLEAGADPNIHDGVIMPLSFVSAVYLLWCFNLRCTVASPYACPIAV